MTSNEPSRPPGVKSKRWWMFWRWTLPPYRGRRDRLSAKAQGEAANYGMRAGH